MSAQHWQTRVAAQPENAAQQFLGDAEQTRHETATDHRRFDSGLTAKSLTPWASTFRP